MQTDADGKLASLPTPQYGQRRFLGWYTDRLNGQRVDASHVFTEDTTLYAHWAEASGAYDTGIRREVVEVDRGLGRVAMYLTNGSLPSDTGGSIRLPEYIGDHGSSVYRYRENDFRLQIRGQFYGNFYDSATTASYSDANYSNVRIELTPFAGESFSGTPAVTASCYDEATGQQVELAVDVRLSGEKIVISCRRPTQNAYITFTVTLDGRSQTLALSLSGNYEDAYEKTVHLEAETWAEVLALLEESAGDPSTYYYIVYTGSRDVVLADTLTLEANQSLALTSASLTVAETGAVICRGTSSRYGAGIEARGITIAGTVSSQGPRRSLYAGSGGILVQGTARITVSNGGELDLYAGDITAEDGSRFTASGAGSDIYLGSSASGSTSFAGTVEGDGTVSFHGNTTLAESASISASSFSWSANSTQGTQTLINRGTVDSSSYASFYGEFENYGVIRTSGSSISVNNRGYSVYNYGTIETGGQLYVDGTVLVNQGGVTGSGRLYCSEALDATDYDDGIDPVPMDTSAPQSAGNYEHKECLRDPATSAEITWFIGELRSEGEGFCDLTVSE